MGESGQSASAIANLAAACQKIVKEKEGLGKLPSLEELRSLAAEAGAMLEGKLELPSPEPPPDNRPSLRIGKA